MLESPVRYSASLNSSSHWPRRRLARESCPLPRIVSHSFALLVETAGQHVTNARISSRANDSYKDSFQIKSEYFERKVPVSFYPIGGVVDSKGKDKENLPHSRDKPPTAHPKPTLPATALAVGDEGGRQRCGTPDSLEVSIRGGLAAGLREGWRVWRCVGVSCGGAGRVGWRFD